MFEDKPEIKVTPKNDGTVSAEVAPSNPENVDSLQLAGFLNVDQPSIEQKEQLKTIWDFFNDGKKSPAEIMWAIKQTENRLSAPRMGETRLAKIYQYAKLRSEIENNEKLLDSL